MSLVNFSAPYFATPAPLTTNFYQPQPYLYPTPQHPFRGEEVPQQPLRPPSFTKVQSSGGGTTRVHAIVDYDDSDYYEEADGGVHQHTPVAPIQGPIFIKNGSVPVVPLYSYPVLNNGTFVQIPFPYQDDANDGRNFFCNEVRSVGLLVVVMYPGYLLKQDSK
ncbi:hypothetical protein FQA39_LY02880 [Lamprigera yunnana]|nr:hypothetical protein FQA39_LY02880 [Lamprigera yunnana]